MFCVHCGTYLEESVETCPYCLQSQLEAIKDMEYYNKEKLMELCPDINELVSFEFRGYEHTFDKRYSRIINTYRFFERLLFINKAEFVERMVRIQEFDKSYAEKLCSLAMEGFRKIALLTEALFRKECIGKDYDEICKTYKDIIQLQFRKIELEIYELDRQKMIYDDNRTSEYRSKMENNYKTRWIGGGYGVSGAIRGSLQASMMNAGTSMMTGTAKTIGYISSNVIANREDRNARSNRFNSEAFRIEVAQNYTYALSKILQWNCGVIDKDLSASIFSKDLQKRAKKELNNLNINMSSEELIQKCCSILSYNPYYEDVYVYMYEHIHDITSKEIISLASSFWGNTLGLRYAFMQNDVDLIKMCRCSLDDMEETSQKKFKDLRMLARKNWGYGDWELATTAIACCYKDNYVRNWFQAGGYRIRSTVGYRNKSDISPIRWDYAEENAAYAYTLYSVYEEVAMQNENISDTGKALLDENQNLQQQIKKGNKTAICIWAALHAKYAILKRKSASKYTEVVWKLANKGDALAMAIVGEWFDQGTSDYPENKYVADMFFRLAMLQGNPYAIAYIGYYYKCGYAGYPSDRVFANELFDLSIEVPLSRDKRAK